MQLEQTKSVEPSTEAMSTWINRQKGLTSHGASIYPLSEFPMTAFDADARGSIAFALELLPKILRPSAAPSAPSPESTKPAGLQQMVSLRAGHILSCGKGDGRCVE